MTAVAVAFVAALALTDIVRRFARSRGITDDPGGHKGHRTPTPLLGGVAVALAIVAGLMPALLDSPSLAAPSRWLLVAGLALGTLGLVDDLRPLSPFLRLAVEAAVCGGLALAGIGANITGIAAVDAVLSTAWLVLILNSVNLLDNADGILGSVSALTAAALAATGGSLPLAVCGAALGFLCHNRPPARIFLGDAGSLLLGTLLAGSALLAARTLEPGVTQVAWLLLIGAPAVADTTLVVISRLRSGRSILQGGTDHAAHRLRRLGLSPRETMAAVAAHCGVTASAACLLAVDALSAWAALGGAVVLIGLSVGLLLRIPGYPTSADRPAADVPVQTATRSAAVRVDRPHR